MIFDISGTTMDFGSRGPVAAFVELFARHGVTLSEAEARLPMGSHKADHVWSLLSNPAIGGRWKQVHGMLPDRGTLENLYPEFGPIQREVLTHHLDLLPGVAEVSAALRAGGVRIGSTTGFESGMIGDLKAAAAAQGYEPDCWVCPDEVGGGRPAPWMIFHASRQLGVYPPRTFVKVGDTPVDIAEAQNAGAWAVSVVRTGNEIGLSREHLDALPAARRAELFAAAEAKFLSLGAHYVVDSVAELLPVVDLISERIDRGERP